ncbi:MAG TPA: hypothetical protein PK624_07340 [Spirochaetota bacterium]|nr:hypothetical protein [Spirochaetota bacterium]HOR44594.1 hypothetical protein [Spirochaetota bacterium]HOU83340.1 hypothetical protein [Spirochaetota bacterium]HPK56009.1 hypothetical protein [Spirochaetota bacterium]HQE57711.1 hypothetical protein [Spirochaetota bacterium]
MEHRPEYMPENNLIILLLLLIFSAGLYYFWWLARTSRIFGDNPVSNIMLTIFTAGIWGVYLNLKYMQKAEEINDRDLKWYMIIFLPLSVLIIQNSINERYFPGK